MRWFRKPVGAIPNRFDPCTLRQLGNKTVRDKIKQLKNKQGLTQDKLARKSDFPYTTLTKIKTNVITKPSIQTVIKIAKGLEISLDDLMK